MAWWNRVSGGRGPGAGGGWRREGSSDWRKAQEENDLLRQINKSTFRKNAPSVERKQAAKAARAERQAKDTARSARAMSKLNREAREARRTQAQIKRNQAANAKARAKAIRRGTWGGGSGGSPLSGGGTKSRAGKSPLAGGGKGRSSSGRGGSTVGQRMSGGSKGRGGRGKSSSRFGKRLY